MILDFIAIYFTYRCSYFVLGKIFVEVLRGQKVKLSYHQQTVVIVRSCFTYVIYTRSQMLHRHASHPATSDTWACLPQTSLPRVVSTE